MAKKKLAVASVVVGLLLLLLSLSADGIGLGVSPGLGWKQIVGAVVGAVLAGAGAVMLRR